jgi:hypothetical protein
MEAREWEAERERWVRCNRMDVILPQLQAQLDRAGALPHDVVSALSHGVDAARGRRLEESASRALVSALAFAIVVPTLLDPPGSDVMDLMDPFHAVLDAASREKQNDRGFRGLA